MKENEEISNKIIERKGKEKGKEKQGSYLELICEDTIRCTTTQKTKN